MKSVMQSSRLKVPVIDTTAQTDKPCQHLGRPISDESMWSRMHFVTDLPCRPKVPLVDTSAQTDKLCWHLTWQCQHQLILLLGFKQLADQMHMQPLTPPCGPKVPLMANTAQTDRQIDRLTNRQTGKLPTDSSRPRVPLTDA